MPISGDAADDHNGTNDLDLAQRQHAGNAIHFTGRHRKGSSR